MIVSRIFTASAVVLAGAAGAQDPISEPGLCSVENAPLYYDRSLEREISLDTELDLAASVEEIVRALYVGPLMREPEPAGRQNLTVELLEAQERDVAWMQDVVQDHLYGHSEEFETQLDTLGQRYGAGEASYRMLQSIYEAFDYDDYSDWEAVYDACLIRSGSAQFVVTKALIHMTGPAY